MPPGRAHPGAYDDTREGNDADLPPMRPVCNPWTLELVGDPALEEAARVYASNWYIANSDKWATAIMVAMIGCGAVFAVLRADTPHVDPSCSYIFVGHGSLYVLAFILSHAPLRVSLAARRRWRVPIVAALRAAAMCCVLVALNCRPFGHDTCGARALLQTALWSSGAMSMAFYGAFLPLPFRVHAPFHALCWLVHVASSAPDAALRFRHHPCQMARLHEAYSWASLAFDVASQLLVLSAAPEEHLLAERFAPGVAMQYLLLVFGLVLPLITGYLFERWLRRSFLEAAGLHGVIPRIGGSEHRLAIIIGLLGCHLAWAVCHPLSLRMEQLHGVLMQLLWQQ